MNPALGGWLFVRFSWPAVFDRALEGSPLMAIAETFRTGVSGGRLPPLELLKMGVGNFTLPGSDVEVVVRTFLNDTFFSAMGAELPAGYIDLLASNAPGIIADRGLLGLLCGTIILTAFRAIRSWTPAVYLVVFGILVWIFGDLPFGGKFWNGDVLFALSSGGAVATAFILAPEPASGAKSQPGMLAVAVLCGLLSWAFRYQGLEFYGCFFAVALLNGVTPVIRSFERRWLYSLASARSGGAA
jgi:electron transport complex protein RnfD